MKHTNKLIVGASVGALLNLSVLGAADAKAPDDQSAAAMAQELKQLQEQVDSLKKRLDAQAAAEQQTKAAADSAAAQAASAKADTAAIPAQVQSAIAAAKPKSDKIYYKGVTLTLGGFGAAETVFRNHNESADVTSGFSAIPYGNSGPGQTNELRFTARQSRITALAEGSPNDTTHLSFYGELDFLGAAQTANSNESNSYNPRIRVLYTNVDWDDLGLHLLTGQSWSLVTLNAKGITPRTEVLPPVIDAQYVPGFNWARQPQIRITKDFDKTLWLGLSLENPQTTFYTGATALPKSVILTYNETGGSGFNSANTLSLNHIPDIVAKVAYDAALPDRNLHVEAYGLYRSFYERLDYSNQNTSGGGFGAGLIVPVVPKLLDFQLSGLAGKGIGRYGSAQLTDVTFDPAGNIRPISEVDVLAGLTLHATPQLDVYLFAGQEKESAQAYYLTSGTGAVTGYGYGNPLYSNSGCGTETSTGSCVGNTRVIQQGTAGFWYKPYVGSFGRYQWGMQYSRTEREAFSGVGGAPIGNESMVFMSFRYYPF
jgi:hypothetical protein